MPELRELDLKIFDALGMYVKYMRDYYGKDNGTWVLFDAKGSEINDLGVYKEGEDNSLYSAAHTIANAERAIKELCPNFSGSLDACKPLIEEINKIGTLQIEFKDDGVSVNFTYRSAYQDNDPDISEWGRDKNAAAALCRAYLKFKELTTKEETK